MVNAEKHRKKILENNIQEIVDLVDGTAINRISKKKNKLESKIKPTLNSRMNMNYFRNELKKEQEIYKNLNL